MTGHGGNIYKAARMTGIPVDRICDFSASINPLGTPATAVAAIKKSIALLPHYPEPSADSAAAVISRRYGLLPGSVIAGNGSTELIYLIPRVLKPKRVLITAPTFSEYEKACRNSGKVELRSLKLKAENCFDTDPDSFASSMKGCDLAFICNPNNPTGRLLRRKDVLRIAEAAKECGCYLVVDEAFMDFCPPESDNNGSGGNGESVMKYVGRNPNLIVLRSITKFYALAGLRIGFGVFPPKVAKEMRKQKEPWTVNCLADKVASAVIEDAAYAEKSLDILRREKRFLEKGLGRLGIKFVPSSANYYLIEMKNAKEVVRNLSQKGILLRDCSNFSGLGRNYIRIAVRTRKENEMLMKEFSELCPAS